KAQELRPRQRRAPGSVSRRAACRLLKIPRPPKATLFPYTTLFRSRAQTQPIRNSVKNPADIPAKACLRGDGRVGKTMNHMNLRRSEEHTSELQSLAYLVCRLLLEKKNEQTPKHIHPDPEHTHQGQP